MSDSARSFVEIAAQLAAARAAAGLTQAEVAGRLGVSQPALSRMENGAGDLRWDVIRRWADALGMSAGVVFAADVVPAGCVRDAAGQLWRYWERAQAPAMGDRELGGAAEIAELLDVLARESARPVHLVQLQRPDELVASARAVSQFFGAAVTVEEVAELDAAFAQLLWSPIDTLLSPLSSWVGGHGDLVVVDDVVRVAGCVPAWRVAEVVPAGAELGRRWSAELLAAASDTASLSLRASLTGSGAAALLDNCRIRAAVDSSCALDAVAGPDSTVAVRPASSPVAALASMLPAGADVTSSRDSAAGLRAQVQRLRLGRSSVSLTTGCWPMAGLPAAADGFFLGLASPDRTAVRLDLSGDAPGVRPAMVVVGQPGSGKSTLAWTLARQAVDAGMPVLWVEPKPSPVTPLPVEDLGGVRVVAGEDTPGMFDPFLYLEDSSVAADIVVEALISAAGPNGWPQADEIRLVGGLLEAAAAGVGCAGEALGYVADEVLDRTVRPLLAAHPELRTLVAEIPAAAPMVVELQVVEIGVPSSSPTFGALVNAVARLAVATAPGLVVIDAAHELRVGDPHRWARTETQGPVVLVSHSARGPVQDVDAAGWVVLHMGADPWEAPAALRLCGVEATEERLAWLRAAGVERRGLCVDRQGRATPFVLGPPPPELTAAWSTRPRRRGMRIPVEVPKGGRGTSSLSPHLAAAYLSREDLGAIFAGDRMRFPVGEVVDVVLVGGDVLAGRLVVAERVVVDDDGRPSGRKVELRSSAGVFEHVAVSLVTEVRSSGDDPGAAGALVPT